MTRNSRKTIKKVISFEYKQATNQRVILSSLTYAASKLWNIANYERKNWLPETVTPYPNWYEQKKRLKEEYWYKNLPSQSAKGSTKAVRRGLKLILGT